MGCGMVKTITVGSKQYQVYEARSNQEKQEGLQKIDMLSDEEGMLFYYDPPQDVTFQMKEVKFPIDIVFINEDEEVVSIATVNPGDTQDYSEQNISYVLEVNANSGIQVGDDLEFGGPVMKVLFPDGSEQYQLWGGERIFSRKNTKILIKKAKKASISKEDKDYKALGKYMFKCIQIQDNREPEYVQSPK